MLDGMSVLLDPEDYIFDTVYFGHVCDLWARAAYPLLRSSSNVKGKAMDIGPRACRVALLTVSNILRACVSFAYTWAWAYSWAWAFFRAESSDL